VVLKDGGGLPFKEVSGKLVIENGALLLSGIKGRFEQSTVRDAALKVKNLFNGPVQYDVSVSGLFDIQDLLRQREVDLIPAEVRKKLQRLEFASGVLDGHIKVLYESGRDRGQLVKGEFHVNDCVVVQKDLFFPLELRDGKIELDDKGRIQFQGTGSWGNSTFKAKGSLDKSLDKGRAFFVAKADINEIMGHFGLSQKTFPMFRGPANCRLTLTRSHDLWSWQGEIDLEGLHMETGSFSIDPPGKRDKIIFDLDYHAQKGVEIRNVTGFLGDSVFKVSGAYSLKESDPYTGQVSTSGLSIGDLGFRFKGSDNTVKGTLVVQARARGFLGGRSRISVFGEMEGRNLSFALGGLPSPITDCHFKMKSTGKEISIPFLRMRVGRSPLRIQGRLLGWSGLKGRLTVNAGFLDLSDFIGGVQQKHSGSQNGTFHKKAPFSKEEKTGNVNKNQGHGRFIERSVVKVKLKGLKGIWRELQYGPFQAECAFRSGNFHIKRSRFQMEHGILRVKGHMKNGERPEKLISTFVKIRKQPVKEILSSLGIGDEYLEGYLTMEGKLAMKGGEWNELLGSLTGNVDLLLEKGKIKKSTVILKVLDFLSLQKIFLRKPPDLSNEGFYYESIKVPVVCNKGVLQIENLVMKSPVFNAVARGKVDLAKEWLDIDLGTQPLGTIDFLVSNIPVLGYILTGEEKSILVYAFKVTGALSNPKVRHVPIKNLGGNTIGVFKRLFFTPRRLLKKMSCLTQALTSKEGPLPEDDIETPYPLEF